MPRSLSDALVADLAEAQAGRPWNLDLAPMAALLKALGNPQDRVPTVLLAGTNGKGSTAVLLSSMLTAAGYRTGLYTSPELESVRETVRIDGVAIADQTLANALEGVLAGARRAAFPQPSPFEALTAAAWLCFSPGGGDPAVDVAVVEVGLGGRDDATNLCRPVLTLLTPIDLDHEAYLGRSLEEIAQVKAGILRPGVPALSWQDRPEVSSTLEQAALGHGTTLIHGPGRIAQLASTHGILQDQRVDLTLSEDGGEQLYSLDLALAGVHQAGNAALAVLAARELRALGYERLDDGAIHRGTAGARWPGRLEVVEIDLSRDRDGDGDRDGHGNEGDPRRVLLDAAHNPAGAAALGTFLRNRGEPFDLLFGVLRDKNAVAMLNHLAAAEPETAEALKPRLVLTRPQGPRGYDPAELLRDLRESRDWSPVFGQPEVIPDLDTALDRLLAPPEPRLRVIAGSLRLVGDLRSRLRTRFGAPLAATDLPTFVAQKTAGEA